MARRGRDAERPRQIPRSGWRDVLLRVRQQVGDDNVGLVSAGVAYYGLLAVFPALTALVSVYGLLADPSGVASQLRGIGAIPPQAREVLTEQLTRIASTSHSGLGAGLVGSLALSTFSAMKGMNALLLAMTIAYDQEDGRSFLHRTAVALGFTFAAILVGAIAILIVVAGPPVIDMLPLQGVASLAAQVLPWLVLTAVFMGAVAVLYRYGPSRVRAQWRWVTPGALLATLLWICASLAFSAYVSHFANYDRTYGSVGAVAVLLLWFFLSAYVVILGAEFDAELEHQTRRDSTTPPPRPMGERGAHVADSLGEVPEPLWGSREDRDGSGS